jgi:hypothetical protein
LRTSGAESDLVVGIASLVWPRFLEVDGLVFLAEHYAADKVRALADQGIAGGELEYWINLFSIDGFFNELRGASLEHAELLAELLAKAWRAKLATEFPLRQFVVNVIRDAEAGDICVVFRSQLDSDLNPELRSTVIGMQQEFGP